jgi:hypothetical protein
VTPDPKRQVSRSSQLTLALAVSSVAVAALVQTALGEWAVAKFGYLEPDIIGLTTAVPAGLVAIGLAVAGTLLPDNAKTVAKLSVVAGSVVVLAIIATNVPSAADGIAARAVPLAVALAASSLWLLVACWIALRR